ncbi:MAG: hypothetical protein JWN56_1493 [Sphingobacteriales bacterium]|nr:hypothetical protein [Sphingobacteriales bacterium]
MLNSPVIDLVILLSFTYFIGSLILSAINEAIAGGLRLRPKRLKFALENMFFGSDWKPFVKNKLAKSQHIESLMKSPGRYPAYLPSKSFVLAIIQQLRKVGENGGFNYTDGTSLSLKISQVEGIPYCLKQILIDFAVQVEANYADKNKQIQEFEKHIEEIFNSAMDRAGGWYKRKTRSTLLALALILSIVLNIDTIKIINDALADKQKLSKAIDNISAKIPELEKLQSISITDSSMIITRASLEASGDNVNKIIVKYNQTTGYTLGYQNFMKEWSEGFFLKVVGILITAFALQLGSNYWFDMLNKAVNIRAAGKRPDEKRPPQI